MNKRKVGRKFNRERDQRAALLRSLARNLIIKERIETSQARAKELRPMIEKLLTRARRQNLSTVRYVSSIFDEKTAWKLLKEIAPKYSERPGGYTRIIKVINKRSDASKRAIIEFVN